MIVWYGAQDEDEGEEDEQAERGQGGQARPGPERAERASMQAVEPRASDNTCVRACRAAVWCRDRGQRAVGRAVGTTAESQRKRGERGERGESARVPGQGVRERVLTQSYLELIKVRSASGKPVK